MHPCRQLPGPFVVHMPSCSLSCFVSRFLCPVIGGGGRGNCHLGYVPSGVRGNRHAQPLTGQGAGGAYAHAGIIVKGRIYSCNKATCSMRGRFICAANAPRACALGSKGASVSSGETFPSCTTKNLIVVLTFTPMLKSWLLCLSCQCPLIKKADLDHWSCSPTYFPSFYRISNLHVTRGQTSPGAWRPGGSRGAGSRMGICKIVGEAA